MNDSIPSRLTGLGGTDAAAALGVSKWKTALDVYLEKRGEAAPIAQNEAMRWGIKLEPVVLEAFRERGFPICPGEFVRSAEHAFMLGNLDALLPGRAVVEAKTARSAEGWGEDGSSEAPADYIVQTHHYMICTRLQLAYIPVLIGAADFRVIEIPFDPELGEMIVNAERDLWERIQAGTPPPPRTLADVNALYRQSRAETIEATPEIAVKVATLRDLRCAIAEIEAGTEAAEKAIKEFLGARDTLTYQGRTLCTWRESKAATVFDSKRFRAENPALAEAYEIGRAPIRRFLLKGSE